MFQYILGDVSWPGAAILAGLFVGIGICFSIYRTTPRKTKEDYEYNARAQQNQFEQNKFQLETNRILETKKLEKNLITSHRED